MRAPPPLACAPVFLACTHLLVACTQSGDPAELITGTATLTLDGSPAGPEDVVLTAVVWSEISDEGGGVLTAVDDTGVYELILEVESAETGDHTPTRVRFRKGLQVLLDHDATCALSLSDTGDAEQRWAGTFDCTGLVSEDPEGTDDGWAIADGTFSGGSTIALTIREEAFAGPGWRWGVELLGPEFTEPIDESDLDRTTVIPWRSDEVWLLMEDGGGEDTGDDLLLKVRPETGAVSVAKWTRASAMEDVAISLTLLSEDGAELTAAVEETGVEAAGADLDLELWTSPHADPDEVGILVSYAR